MRACVGSGSSGRGTRARKRCTSEPIKLVSHHIRIHCERSLAINFWHALQNSPCDGSEVSGLRCVLRENHRLAVHAQIEMDAWTRASSTAGKQAGRVWESAFTANLSPCRLAMTP